MPPDRQGITEIKHVTGYLAYWDELRRRHPDMLIDSCARAAGATTWRRCAAPCRLWRSDYAFEPIGHQCMTYGLSMWMPYHGTGTVACAQRPLLRRRPHARRTLRVLEQRGAEHSAAASTCA